MVGVVVRRYKKGDEQCLVSEEKRVGDPLQNAVALGERRAGRLLKFTM